MSNSLAKDGLFGIFGIGMKRVSIPGKSSKITDICFSDSPAFCDHFSPDLNVLKVTIILCFGHGSTFSFSWLDNYSSNSSLKGMRGFLARQIVVLGNIETLYQGTFVQ